MDKIIYKLQDTVTVECYPNGDIFGFQEHDEDELSALGPGEINFYIDDIDTIIDTLLDLKRELRNHGREVQNQKRT